MNERTISVSNGNTYPINSEPANELAEGEEIDEGLTTSKWQASGFYANFTKSHDEWWSTSVVVPHGVVVIPLMLLSFVLLLNPSTFQRTKSSVS